MSSSGERIALIWAAALVAVVFLLQNPLMPGSVRLDFGQTCQEEDFTPGGSDGVGGCFPGLWNTGVPAGTSLSAYGGPMTVTTNGTTIDAKTITGDLRIEASGVVITNSRIVGTLEIEEEETGASYSITDSDVQCTPDAADTCLGSRDYTATRVQITGGRRSLYCWTDCTIEDSYAGDQATDVTGTFHQSGLRMTQDGTFTHNTIWCNAPDVEPDGGCSANQTGYGDFITTQNNLFQGNLFPATTGGTCSYGGSTSGKPFPTANNIRFINNIYGRVLNGEPRLNDHGNPDCGFYFAVADYDTGGTGNAFTNNRFDSTSGPLVVPNTPT